MGVYLATPNKEKKSIDEAYGSMRAGASAMQGWRINMEDAHICKFNIAKDVSIFGVFDGHGGREVAKFVEKHFIQELLDNSNFKIGEYKNALHETFLRMDVLLQTSEGHQELIQYKTEDGKGDSDSFAGCTACVALLVKNELYCANAGDSRCLLSRNGKAIEMSHDHKPDNEKEKDRVQRAGGYVSDGRINGNLNLSRAIGDLEYKKDDKLKVSEQLIIAVPDIEKQVLTSDDEFFILGCDGIWECKSNQEIIDFVGKKIDDKSIPVSLIVEELLDAILAPATSNGVGCDNMSCIVIALKQNLKKYRIIQETYGVLSLL